MTLYLARISRPEISYDVHQCARFAHGPNHSYEVVIKHISKYLKETRDQGLIMMPNMIEIFQSNLYVDADFVELFASEDKMDPTSVKSGAGMLPTLGNLPMFWSSKTEYCFFSG